MKNWKKRGLSQLSDLSVMPYIFMVDRKSVTVVVLIGIGVVLMAKKRVIHNFIEEIKQK